MALIRRLTATTTTRASSSTPAGIVWALARSTPQTPQPTGKPLSNVEALNLTSRSTASPGKLEAENISRLRYLKTVGGSLIIRNNKFGTTGLRGLDRLEDVGSVLAIEKNTLSSLYGLAALRTVGFSLFVNENASLASLQGLRNLASVGADLTIQKNPNLCQDAVNTFAAGVSVAGQTNLSSNNGGCSDSDNDDVYADDCNDANSLLGSRYNDADCDGVITPNDCDDNDGSETNTCVACVGNVYIYAPQDATGWVDSQGTDVSLCRSVTKICM